MMTTLIKPTKPWAKSPIERIRGLGFLVAAVGIAYLVVANSGLSGKLGYVFAFFVAYGAIVSSFSFFTRGLPAAKDAIVNILVALGAVITLVPIASIIWTVLQRGLPGIRLDLFTNDMSMAAPTDPLDNGGVLHAITGTLTLVALALLISVPIAILTALYLTEINGRFSGPIRFLVQAMSGVPSIVAGLFILSAVLYPITKGYSALMGALALSILMIPTVARTAEEVLLLIPNDLREAGTALGGTQWRTVSMIVVPAARSGLMTAVILGIARIAGETAPLLLLTGGGDSVNPNPFNGSVGSLPYYIWKSFNAGSEEAITRAWAGLLVLMLLVLILFVLARALSTRKVSK
jgi:phosphate transport system permease protein